MTVSDQPTDVGRVVEVNRLICDKYRYHHASTLEVQLRHYLHFSLILSGLQYGHTKTNHHILRRRSFKHIECLIRKGCRCRAARKNIDAKIYLHQVCVKLLTKINSMPKCWGQGCWIVGMVSPTARIAKVFFFHFTLLDVVSPNNQRHLKRHTFLHFFVMQ